MTSIPEWLKTDHPREVIAAPLAHVVQSRVEAAYVRSDLFGRRRVLMDEWARHLTPWAGGGYRGLKAKRPVDPAGGVEVWKTPGTGTVRCTLA